MAADRDELNAARLNTKAAYEKHVDEWFKIRTSHFRERSWVDRCVLGLPPRARVLDLGCGTGNPIASHLLELGLDVTGVDFAPSMIAVAQEHFSSGKWIVADMRSFESDDLFDAVISWDGFFHLSQTDQLVCLERLSAQIHPEHGRLMMTVGQEAGEVTGTVFGDDVYHASVGEDEYRRILKRCGFSSVEIHQGGADIERTILFAER